MKVYTRKMKFLSLLMMLTVLLSSCASTTLIDSYPSGAYLYLNGEAVGETPYYMTDTKPMFSCTSVRIEKDNYKPFYTTICRNEEADVGAIIGGVFFSIPFIWSMKYKPTHFYRLRSEDEKSQIDSPFDTFFDDEEAE